MKHIYRTQHPTFRVGNIDIQTVARPRGYRHSFKNGRAKHGFIYVVSGVMQDAFANAEYEDVTLNAGEMIFIPSGCVYTGTYFGENTKIQIVQFNAIDGELPEYLSAPTRIEIPQVKDCMKLFFGYAGSTVSEHPFYYLSCLYQLLFQLDESYEKIPKKYKKLQPALSELAEYWDKTEPVSYYAGLCKMSEANFRRLFREYTGLSPVDYRNELRLDNAQKRLLSEEYTVSETAESCGFTNLSYFTRAYKKKFGYTPKKE